MPTKKYRLGSLGGEAIDELLHTLLESANNPDWDPVNLRELFGEKYGDPKGVFVLSLDHISRTGKPPFWAVGLLTRASIQRSPPISIGVDEDGLYWFFFVEDDDPAYDPSELAEKAKLAVGDGSAVTYDDIVDASYESERLISDLHMEQEAHLALILLCGDSDKRRLVRHCTRCGSFYLAKGNYQKGRGPNSFCTRACRYEFHNKKPLPEEAQKRIAYQREVLEAPKVHSLPDIYAK